MNYQYELTHFKGDMGHGAASDVSDSCLETHSSSIHLLGLGMGQV